MSQPGVAAGAVRPGRRWLLLILLVAGMFFTYAHRATLTVAAPFMMKDLGLDTTAMGVLLSAFFWSYSLLQVPAGWLVDRYGLGRAYAAGFFIWTVAATLTGFAATVPMLIAVRVLMGVGQSVAFPASARAVANWFPARERGSATGLYLSGNRLGQAAVTGIGPVAIAAFGWRAFFAIAGVLGFLWLLGWLPTLKTWEAGPAGNATAPGKQASGKFRLILRDRRMAGIFLGFFAYDYVWYLFLTWMPGYLMLERKFGPREMGFYGSVPFLAVSVVIVLAGIAGDVLVRAGWNDVAARKTLITAGLLIACLIVPAAFVGDNIVCAWLLAIAICGLGLTAPNAWALTQTVCERDMVATAGGIQNLGGNLGGVVAPVLTGFIAQRTGSFGPAFAIAGIVAVCGIACYWVLIPSRSR